MYSTNGCAVQVNNVKTEKKKGRAKEPLIKENITSLGKMRSGLERKLLVTLEGKTGATQKCVGGLLSNSYGLKAELYP